MHWSIVEVLEGAVGLLHPALCQLVKQCSYVQQTTYYDQNNYYNEGPHSTGRVPQNVYCLGCLILITKLWGREGPKF